MHFLALCIKRFIYFKRDYKGLFCEIFLPCIIVTIGFSVTLIRFVKDPKESPLTPGAYLTTSAQTWVNYPAGDAKIKSIMDMLSPASKFSVANKLDITDISAFQTELVKTRSNPRFWAYFMNPVDQTNKIYSYATFVNTTVPAAFPLASAVMDSVILKDATGDDTAYIKVFTRGLKLSGQYSLHQNIHHRIEAHKTVPKLRRHRRWFHRCLHYRSSLCLHPSRCHFVHRQRKRK